MYRNLPNLLTGLRLILIPFIVQALWNADYRQAVLLLWVAGVTDLLDGYLARRFQWTSRLGAYLDPAGDKLMLVSVYVTLGLRGAVPLWLMWLVLGRDAVILGMVAIALLVTAIRSFPPSIWGKISTVIQVMGALIVIAGRAYVPGESRVFEQIVVPVIALATVVSGLHYLWKGFSVFFLTKSATSSPK